MPTPTRSSPRRQSPHRAPLARRRAAIGAALLLAAGAACAQVYRCEAGGRVVYQQSPCSAGATGDGALKLRYAATPAAPPASAAEPTPPQAPAASPQPPAPLAAQPPAQPRKSETEQLADRCLEWYRPMLRDPRGAYHRDARYEKRVVTILVFATNGWGGYTSKPASCEIRNGRIDDDWTRILAQRLGWPV